MKNGTNLRLSIGRARRAAVRRFYEEGMRAKRVSPREDLDQFILDDGFSTGVFYVDDARALGDEVWALAPWLEYQVDDVAAAEKRLIAAGAVRVPFDDASHPYLRGPGGPVFRLSSTLKG